ncbi:hypothetical protein KAU33_05300 [Candidatus Dependentiae bacterium]|nr:hypothetical protein [Candidatus Dependentiae bacterium]
MSFIPAQTYCDPLDIEWSEPEIISLQDKNDIFLKSDLSILLDGNKIAITWIKGKVGNSSLYLFLKDDSGKSIIQVTKGHEDRDPRIFKFKDKYHIIFSRRIIETNNEIKSYMTPSILMITDSTNLQDWSIPRIIRINLKNQDNHEPFIFIDGENLRILWTTGNFEFEIFYSETTDLKTFSAPKRLFNLKGPIHYPYLLKTKNSKCLLFFQLKHSLYFSQSLYFTAWKKPKYMMKHSSREYRPAIIQLPDERILVFFNSAAFIWYTENLEKYNYDNWFKPIQLNLKKSNEKFKDYMIQEIHPVIAQDKAGNLHLTWSSKRNGLWNIYYSAGKVEKNTK